MSNTKIYTVEERSFQAGRETWARVSATGSRAEAVKRARDASARGGSYRVVVFEMMRVAGTFHGAGVRR